MHHYYVIAELGEGIPDYNFVLAYSERKELPDVYDEAKKIVHGDYPDHEGCKIIVQKVTGEELLDKLTIN